MFNRNFAVIIGINNYKNDIRELKTAVPDAKELAKIVGEQHTYLKDKYREENKYKVQLIEDASLNQLQGLIKDFKNKQISFENKKVTVTKDDRLLFYFAGHGIALDALDNQEGPVGYLIPEDATSGDSNTYLPMQDLHDALNALPCRHMLAILDCCFAGAFRWASLKREIVPKLKVYKERYDRFISDAAWQVITSAADNQKALDSLGTRGIDKDENNHSPFAKALFDALRGEGADLNKDGIVTATELYSYLRDQVEIDSENHYQRQTPSLCPLRKHDKGEFIFLLPNFDRDKLEDAPPLNLENNPYRGLESYDEKDSHLFFGRENLIQKLYQKVVANKQALTLVLGASGTGKSSLMKAGLLKRLRDSQEPKFEILDPMRPGESPLKALAQVCLPMLPLGAAERAIATAEELVKDEQALANIIECWSQTNPKIILLLPVDQFEELITLCKSDQEREQFLKLLDNAIAKYPDKIHVVITLRLDFEAQFQSSVLKDFWNDDTRFVVPPMSQNEFREAIEKPASEKVVYFDAPSLVDELINEVVQMPGALPLLSFTLSELYLKYLGDRTRDNRALTKTDYEDLGRVVGSITKRANQEYDKLVAILPAYEHTVRRVMLRMISLQGGESARRPVPKSELVYPDQQESDRVQEVIKHFSQARLIVEGSNSEGEPYVEPAHDALVKGWDKLLVWKKEEWKNLVLQNRLTPAANDWKEREGYLWTEEEGRLLHLRAVINRDQNSLNKVETDFVNKSIEEKRKRFEENEKQRDEALKGQITALAALSEARFQDNQLGALIHILKAARILQQLRDSKSQYIQDSDIPIRTEIVLRQTLSKVQECNRLEVGSISAMNFSPKDKIIATAANGNLYIWSADGRLLNSLRIGVISVAFSDDGTMMALGRGNGFLCWKLDSNEILEVPSHQVNTITFSPDSKMIVTGEQYENLGKVPVGIVKLWKSDGTLLKELEGLGCVIMTVCFSPDNQLIVASGWWGAWVLWQSDGTKLRSETPLAGSLNAADFSPDSGIFITAGNDGRVILWNREGEFLRDLRDPRLEQKAHEDKIWSAKFSPNGQMIATGSNDRKVKLWNLDGTLLKTFEGHTSSVSVVRFSPDGHILASASDDGTVKFWKLSTPLMKILDGHTDTVYTVRFSPDNKLFTTSGGGWITCWDTDGTLLQTKMVHNGPISTLEFSLNGMMVTASGDKSISLWNSSEFWKEGSFLKSLDTFKPEVLCASFSPNNDMVATGGVDKTIKLWSSDGSLVKILGEHEDTIWGVSFSPDGETIASASADGRVKLWNIDGSGVEPLQGAKVQFVGITFSPDNEPDNQIIAAAAADETVRLWKRDGTELPPLKGHEKVVRAVCFSPNGQLIATASYDKTVKLWNRDGTLKTTLHGHTDHVNAVAFSKDGKTLASASNDKTAILWNLEQELELDQLIDYGCQWISGYLTNNPNVSESDRKVLFAEKFFTLKYDSKKWI